MTCGFKTLEARKLLTKQPIKSWRELHRLPKPTKVEVISPLSATRCRKFGWRQELIQADRLATLGSLVAGVAHDITNPTNLIAMNKEVLYTHLRDLENVISELLKDATGPEAEILFEMFKKVFHNSHEALSEITLWLDRIYAINQAIRKQSRRDNEKTGFVVHELLKECITIVKARSKAVELKLTGDESTEFIAYRSHLGQVIMNLLSNGIDAAEEFVRADESSPEVVLGFKRRSDHLNLWIQDNGPGVHEYLREKIFIRFAQPSQVVKVPDLECQSS